MGYIKQKIIPGLKHTAFDTIISENVLKNSLWYSISCQSYLQRNCAFDGSWLDSSAANTFVALYLMQKFDIAQLYMYETMEKCMSTVDAFNDDEYSSPYLACSRCFLRNF